MDAKFRALPPGKRFRAMQQHQQQLNQQQVHSRGKENIDPSSSSSSFLTQPLPAKKRKESRHIPLPFDNPFAAAGSTAPTTTTYCLPAKKRVWAFAPPDFEIPVTPLSSIDLNVRYNQVSFFDDDNEGKQADLKFLSVPEQNIKEGDKIQIEAEEEEKEKNQLPTSNCQQNPPDLINQEEEEPRECVNVDEEDDGIVCAICQSTDGDPQDPIVFCDGCDLMVHTTCYGNPLIREIPEGEWFCNQCLSSSSNSKPKAKAFPCCLCPNKGGALKSTSDGRWAHVVCALFVPEVFFQDSDARDGIDCSRVPERRWQQRCYVCEGTRGCAIECSEQKCSLAFHVTCGVSEDLCIEYREGNGKGDIVAGFCKRHTKLWEKQQQTGKFKIVARDEQ